MATKWEKAVRAIERRLVGHEEQGSYYAVRDALDICSKTIRPVRKVR